MCVRCTWQNHRRWLTQSTGRIRINADEGLVEFKPVHSEDEGIYTCIAINDVGSANTSANVRVLGTLTSHLSYIVNHKQRANFIVLLDFYTASNSGKRNEYSTKELQNLQLYLSRISLHTYLIKDCASGRNNVFLQRFDVFQRSSGMDIRQWPSGKRFCHKYAKKFRFRYQQIIRLNHSVCVRKYCETGNVVKYLVNFCNSIIFLSLL